MSDAVPFPRLGKMERSHIAPTLAAVDDQLERVERLLTELVLMRSALLRMLEAETAGASDDH